MLRWRDPKRGLDSGLAWGTARLHSRQAVATGGPTMLFFGTGGPGPTSTMPATTSMRNCYIRSTLGGCKMGRAAAVGSPAQIQGEHAKHLGGARSRWRIKHWLGAARCAGQAAAPVAQPALSNSLTCAESRNSLFQPRSDHGKMTPLAHCAPGARQTPPQQVAPDWQQIWPPEAPSQQVALFSQHSAPHTCASFLQQMPL